MPGKSVGTAGAGDAANSPLTPQKFYQPIPSRPGAIPAPAISSDGSAYNFANNAFATAVRYQASESDFIAPAGTVFEDSDSWWGGVVNLAVNVAIAATLSLTSSMAAAASQPYHQDDPAGNLSATVDEYFWSNPTAPVPAALGRIYLPDPDEIPAAQLHAQFDEDFWQNPTAPVPAALGRLYLPDPDEIPTLHGQYDEDFWQNPAAPVPATLGSLYLPDRDETPVLFGQFDEDFWSNPTAPVLGTLGSIYLPDPDEIPAGSLFGVRHEEYWQNPLSPIVASWNLIPAPIDLDSTFPSVTFVAEDDSWQNPAPLSPVFYQQCVTVEDDFVAPAPSNTISSDGFALAFVSNIFTSQVIYQVNESDFAPPLGHPDEDFWSNPAAPVAATLLPYTPWSDDDFVALAPAAISSDGQTATFAGNIPTWTVIYQASESDFVAPTVTFTPNEDYWTSIPRMSNNWYPAPALVLSPSDDMPTFPAPPASTALDERITYDRYATGLYITGHTSIGEDL